MPVPLRVLALFIVVSALVLTTLATALADQHPAAADGQRLEDQSAEVQALYRAVYGDDAEARWIAEHNAAIGMSMMDDMMMGDMSMDDPMSNMYYDRIVAVAMARGADAELASRIAADVISRGTEAEPSWPAPTPACFTASAESEDSTSTRRTGAPSAPSSSGERRRRRHSGHGNWFDVCSARVPTPSDSILLTGVALSPDIVLPVASVAPPPGYGLNLSTRVSGLPSGLSVTRRY